MTEIKRAIVKSYDAAAHKATVQIGGSLAVWLDDVRVATDIPAGELIAGRQCSVLFLDPSNQDDAIVITIQGAAPAGPGGGLQNRITDADNDTRVETEQAADEDKVRVIIAGVERGLFQTTSPHITLTGDLKATEHMALGPTGSILAGSLLFARETFTDTAIGVNSMTAILSVPTLQLSANRIGFGDSALGGVFILQPAGNILGAAYGLGFSVDFDTAGTITEMFASRVSTEYSSLFGTLIGTDHGGYLAGAPVKSGFAALSGIANHGFLAHNQGHASIPTSYAFRGLPQSGSPTTRSIWMEGTAPSAHQPGLTIGALATPTAGFIADIIGALRITADTLMHATDTNPYRWRPVRTAAPALGDMNVGDLAFGLGTGGGGEDELFWKPNASRISRFEAADIIT